MKKLSKLLKKQGYVSVDLLALDLGDEFSFHLLVKARINGRKGKFLLDTGASRTLIDISKAEKYGLDAQQPDEDMVFKGAGAEDLDVMLTGNLSRIKIGKWKFNALPVLMMPLDHVNKLLDEDDTIDGVIGTDVLILGQAVLDYNNGKLYLKPVEF